MIRLEPAPVRRAGQLSGLTIAVRRPAAVAILVFFSVISIGLAYALSMAQDESFSLHSSAHGFAQGLHEGITFEAQAPLYFGLLGAWRTIDGSLFFARLPSIAFSIVTLAYTWHFARRYIQSIAPEIILAVVAVNPFFIWASVETRPYPLAIALSTALLYYFFRGWVDTDVYWQARTAFVIAALLGEYTQYYVVLLLPAGVLALIVLRRWTSLPTFLAVAIVVGVTLAPITFFLSDQLSAYSALAAASQLPAFAIVLALFDMLYPHDSIGSWVHRPLENVCYFGATLVPALLLCLWIRRFRPVTVALLTITAALTAMFAVLLGFFHIHVIFPRHTAVLFAPAILATFALCGDAPLQRRAIIVKSFGAIYAVLAVLSLWTNYHGLSKAGDWHNVGSFLNAHVQRNDAVTIFDAEAALPLSYYFSALPVIPLPREQSLQRFDEDTFRFRDEHEVAQSLGHAAAGRRHVWLVANDVCTNLPAFYGCPYLDAYIAGHFKIIASTEFNGSSVTELSAKERPKP